MKLKDILLSLGLLGSTLNPQARAIDIFSDIGVNAEEEIKDNDGSYEMMINEDLIESDSQGYRFDGEVISWRVLVQDRGETIFERPSEELFPDPPFIFVIPRYSNKQERKTASSTKVLPLYDKLITALHFAHANNFVDNISSTINTPNRLDYAILLLPKQDYSEKLLRLEKDVSKLEKLVVSSFLPYSFSPYNRELLGPEIVKRINNYAREDIAYKKEEFLRLISQEQQGLIIFHASSDYKGQNVFGSFAVDEQNTYVFYTDSPVRFLDLRRRFSKNKQIGITPFYFGFDSDGKFHITSNYETAEKFVSVPIAEAIKRLFD